MYLLIEYAGTLKVMIISSPDSFISRTTSLALELDTIGRQLIMRKNNIVWILFINLCIIQILRFERLTGIGIWF